MSLAGTWIGPGSVNRRILSAAAAVTAAGILVKLVATCKEFAVAGTYGRSDAMDAFLAASLIPGLLVNLISESMNQALVPTLIRVRQREGHARAQDLLSSSMAITSLMLVAGSVVAALTARGFFPLIGSHFTAAKLDLSERLFCALLPTVLLTGIATNCTAVLNTSGRFAWPAIAPLVIPLSILVGAPVLSGHAGVWALVYSTLLGSLIYAVWVVWMMERGGYHFSLRWQGATESSLEVARQHGPVLLSSIVSSGGLLVDQSMAAMLPAGSVSTLVFAGRFVSVVLNLLAGAVSSAVVPSISELIAQRDWEGCRRTIRTWAWLTAAVSTPIALALILGARTLVRATFQHGVFGPNDTDAVAPVLAMYALQIPFFVTSRVYYRFIVAMRRTRLILYCGLLNLGLDIVLNLLLMRAFGVAGIALATSLWTVSTFFFLWYWSRRLLSDARDAVLEE